MEEKDKQTDNVESSADLENQVEDSQNVANEVESNDNIQEEQKVEGAEEIDYKRMSKSNMIELCQALSEENNVLIAELEESKNEIIRYQELDKQLQESTNKLQQSKAETEEYKNRLINMKNDFDRFKVRNQNIEEEARENGKSNAIEKVFSVLDTFDRAMNSVTDKATIDVLNLIKKQFERVLDDLGVTEIEVLDKEFDPSTANAVLKQKVKEKKKKNTVITVVSKGYKANGKILKYPQVVVGI